MTSADPAHHLLIDSRRSWTEQEVWTTADRIAHQVRAECLHPASPSPRRFAVFAENAGEAVIAHVGGMRAGASVVAMSAHLNAADAAYMLDTGDVALVVAGPRTADAARNAAALAADATRRSCRVLVWDTPEWDEWLATAPEGAPPDDREIVPNLLFTSGTTGRPKATELPPNVFPRRPSWADFVEATRANRFVGLGRHLVVAPLHHTGPLNAVRALAAGTPIGILDRFDPAATLDAIERWQIASSTLVPTHMARLLALPEDVRSRADVSSLRLVFQTGSACPVDVKRAMIDWWGPVFLEAYGATEVGVTASITSEDWLEHPGSVGRSVAPHEAVVIDDQGNELPPGEEGRLYFRDSTGRGIVYHGDPERSAAAHIEPGVFTLGEIGRVDADGWVYVTDRFADMVVTGGVNVYPAEVEQVLVTHPGVADVAGIGAPHPDLGEQLVALVVPADPASPPEPVELLAWCEERISRYKVPRQVRIVESLNRNALGKLDKRALRAAHTP
ncbi:MAG: AMP-binding protein [Acidimicrobiales bacterium]|nr:AMP-binding protein [Acidimicrobiales bacterium]